MRRVLTILGSAVFLAFPLPLVGPKGRGKPEARSQNARPHFILTPLF